ncbi:MAG: alpha/beta hydrolase fold domain-containing protein [Arenicellales bacterium]|nr:alpha/beta hydrolase fold domain-containing protein [Arenicellales bacterium]
MKIDDLMNEEMRKALQIDCELKAKVPSDGPWDTESYRRQYNVSRAYWNQDGPAMVETKDFVIHTPNETRCRIHYPEHLLQTQRGAPVLIFFHGGGWVVGNLDTHDRMMRELAHRSGHAVLGVDYPLSPEVRFKDSYSSALRVVKTVLTEGAPEALDSSRVALGGDSAGAHMSLYCALQLKQSGLPPIRALILIYGAFGLLDSTSRRLYGENDVGFTSTSMDFYIRALMGDVDPRTAGYDLLARDLSNLPPSLITTCDLDLLRDDSLALAGLLTREGVVNELVEYQGVLHGYVHMSEQVSAAVDTLQRCAEWLKTYV